MEALLADLLANRKVPGYDNVLAHRTESIRRTIELLDGMRPKVMVETGCQSSNLVHAQGISTTIFGMLAAGYGACLYTVDISMARIAACKKFTERWKDSIFYACADSVAYLRSFDKPIDFLYLDSYDFYKGSEEASRKHALAEIEAAFDKLHAGSIVLIDDCNVQMWFGETLSDLDAQGKSAYAHRFLTDRGAQCILDFPSYQRLYRI